MERFGPLIFSVLSGVAFWFYADAIFSTSVNQDWDLSALYAAVFDTASIVCAFLFSFLVFIKTTENKVLSAFRENRFYSIMIKHFIAALISSFFLTIATIPLIIASPTPLEKSFTFYVVMLWFSLFTFVVCATFRSGYQFLAVLEAAYSGRFRS